MANDFSTDANCQAVFNFEAGALMTHDSKRGDPDYLVNWGANDSTGVGEFKEGSCAAAFVAADTDYFACTDENLPTGFPMKSGYTDWNKILSVCFWVKWTTRAQYQCILAKWVSGTNGRTMTLDLDAAYKLMWRIGYNSGNSTEEATVPFGTAFETGVWYHVGAVFADTATTIFGQANKNYGIRIVDAAGTPLGDDITGAFTNRIYVSASALEIGVSGIGPIYSTMVLDEMVLFDRVLTTTEIDAIRNAEFTGGSASASISASPSAPSASPSAPSASLSPSVSASPSAPSASVSASPSAPSPSVSASPSAPSASLSPSLSLSLSASPSAPSASASASPSAPSASVSASPSAPSASESVSVSASPSAGSASASATISASPSPPWAATYSIFGDFIVR